MNSSRTILDFHMHKTKITVSSSKFQIEMIQCNIQIGIFLDSFMDTTEGGERVGPLELWVISPMDSRGYYRRFRPWTPQREQIKQLTRVQLGKCMPRNIDGMETYIV
jgi:hypothetical protein